MEEGGVGKRDPQRNGIPPSYAESEAQVRSSACSGAEPLALGQANSKWQPSFPWDTDIHCLQLPTVPGERRLKTQKQSRDSEHWMPMTTHQGYSAGYWDTISGFQSPQFPHFEPHWKLHLRSQFWLYVKPHLKWRKFCGGLEFRLSGQNSLHTVSNTPNWGQVESHAVLDTRFPQLTNEVILPQGKHLLQENKAPRSLEEGYAPPIDEGALLKSRRRDLPQQNQRGSGVLPNSENKNDVNGNSLSEKFILESGHQVNTKNEDDVYTHKSIKKWMTWSSKQAPALCGLMMINPHAVKNTHLPLDQKYTTEPIIGNSRS